MQSAPQLKTILVVDDDFSVLTALKCMLEASHHNVLLARTADVAISIAQRKGDIDLLLMAVVMPDVSGPDLAETILAIHPSAKVLFLSGYGGSDALGEKVRVVGFLPKPFTSLQLQERIDQVFSSEPQAAAAAPTTTFSL
jgi:two-component system, cell cycle sensor histidine kinase and response regulator CckA